MWWETFFTMKFLLSSFILLLHLPGVLQAQATVPDRPKLIVGIVVDQMRYDYLYRYYSSYGNGGFKRLLNSGFSCENTHYNYVPTFTAPGHASIYTGTTPALHGIISNEWWDPLQQRDRYVTSDARYKTVGGTMGKVGQQSPAVLLTTTITDELRLSNNFKSKVVGVCLKDRGSILPAGHIPNACFWFDDDSGNWITSTYYPDSLQLPQWVQDFNARKLAETYVNSTWNRLPDKDYSESFANWWPYKGGHSRYTTDTFSYNLATLRQKTNSYYALRLSPYGNLLTLNFAMEAIDKMGLGTDEWPDFLCLSFSCTDYVGHQFGIHAQETEDVYLKLDRDIERLLQYLDQKFGKDNVLVFLTADHGAAETPAFMQKLNMPAGVFEKSKLQDKLEQILSARLGTPGKYILDIGSQQIWLNRPLLQEKNLNPDLVEKIITDSLKSMPGIYDAFTRKELEQLPTDYPFAPLMRRGIHPQRSGDILYTLDPGWHGDDKHLKHGGTTHGSPYPYDTHVPLLWYGWKIPQGRTFEAVNITDIAPTLAAFLHIMEPSGTTGTVIQPLMR